MIIGSSSCSVSVSSKLINFILSMAQTMPILMRQNVLVVIQSLSTPTLLLLLSVKLSITHTHTHTLGVLA